MRKISKGKASSTVALVVAIVLFSSAAVFAGSITGLLGGAGVDSMYLDNDAAMTLDATVTVNSSVENATEMRIGVPAARAYHVDGNSVRAIGDDGRMRAWGYNWYGQLGNGSFEATSVMQDIGTDSDWADVSGGDAIYGLKADGTLLSWGRGAEGALGDGTTGVDRSTPATVGTPGEWKAVEGGRYLFALAIKKDGSLWSWGYGTSGQLGTGSTVSTSVPVRVGTDNDWKSIHPGYYCSFAIKENGSLWAWGSNSNYQLGIPGSPSVPTQVATGTAFTYVTSDQGCTIALRSDGAMMSWGKGSDGCLGDGMYNDRPSPQVVATGTVFTSVSLGSENVLAVRSDGALFGWGKNTWGQRGDGTSDYWRFTPSQIGSSTAWTSAESRGAMGIARAGDVLYTWGANGMGLLGDGSSLSRSTPAAISAGWMPYASQVDWALGSSDGTYTVPVYYRSSGGTTGMLSDSIAYDATPPSGQTVFNDGAASVDTTLVPVRSTMTNVVDMKVGDGPWVSYAKSAVHTVTAGDGVKDLNVLYRDEYSRIVTVTSNILLDTTAPTGTLAVNAGDANTRFRTAIASTTVSADVTAIRMEPPIGWTQLATFKEGLFGIRADGTMWMKNPYRGSYLLGDGNPEASPNFRQVGDGAQWRSVSVAASSRALAVKSDGTLWGWGSSQTGEFQLAGSYSMSVPLKIGAVSTWSTVAAGPASGVGIRTDGTMWAWGSNNYYECAQGSTYGDVKYTPVQVKPGCLFRSVSAGGGDSTYAFAAITTTGSVYTWGLNTYGQLGNGNKVGASGYLVQPTGTSAFNDWVSVAVGERSTYAVRANGDLYAWGDNTYGQLGDGTTTERLNPTLIGTGYKSVFTRHYTVIGVKTDGSMWGWGMSSVGDSSKENRSAPVRIGKRNDWSGAALSQNGVFAYTTSGELFAWGTGFASYGDPTNTVERTRPWRADWFTYSPQFKFTMPAGNGAKTVRAVVRDAAGNTGLLTDTITLDASASAGTFVVNGGSDWSGGTTVTVAANVPNATEMSYDVPFTSVAAGANSMAAVRGDGRAWAWGNNASYKLGDGTTSSRTTPVTSTAMRNFASMSLGGSHTLALTVDGTLYAWGNNGYGQLGTGTYGDTADKPVQIGVYGEWLKVSAGANHSLGIKKDGSLWAWGSDGNYQLGDGSYWNVTSPKRIGAANNWTDISASGSYSVGISGGAVYSWGTASSGQLGCGVSTTNMTPTYVGTTTGCVAVSASNSHVLALKSDGSLFYWGANNYGQLGNGSLVTTTTAKVNLYGGWKAVAAGDDFSVGIRTDGSLWAWGRGDRYQAAAPYTSYSYLPLRVGTANDWAAVDAGTASSIALKTDGTIRTWGGNQYGEVGNGGVATANVYTPVEILPSTWQAYSPSFTMTVDRPGLATPVSMGYRDVAGNVWTMTDKVGFDLESPITSATGLSAGWTNTNTTISLVATDNGGIGVAASRYRVNGGAVATYTAPFTITTEGTNTVDYWSIDAYGRVEATKTAMVRLDKSLPTVSTNVPASGWIPTDTVSLQTSDSVSGFSGLYTVYVDTVLTAVGADGRLKLNPGIHQVTVFAKDNAGNYSSQLQFSVAYDLVSPTSEATGIPVGWAKGPAIVSLTATDTQSGIGSIRWSVDGSAEATYTVPLVINDGVHTLRWLAVDRAGNTEPAHDATLTIDTAGPVSSSDLTGLWSGSPVTFELFSADALSGMGHIDYSIDGAPESPYLSPVTYATEGTHTVEYWGTDVLGNLESPNSQKVLIDYTAPVTTLSGVPTTDSPVTVELVPQPTDGGSGVKQVYYRLNGGQTRPYASDQTAIVVSKDGTNTVDYWSVDNVGNTEALHSVTVVLDLSQGVGSTQSETANAPCITCHGAAIGTQVAIQNFSVTAVNRAAACPKCHTPGLLGTHPQHYAGGNCGGICHPGFGGSLLSGTPSRLTAFGSFTSTSSALLSSDELHVIHNAYRWPADVVKNNRQCPSCHAAASCTACHVGTIAPAHAEHSTMGSVRYPARTTQLVRVGSGIVGEDQTINTVTTMQAQCGIAECHNSSGLVETAGTPFEDHSHAATALLPANTILQTGKWIYQTGVAYTNNKRSYSVTKGSTLTLAFTGTKVSVTGGMANTNGEAEFLIDDVLVGTVNTYSATNVAQTTLWTSSQLERGPHTITVRVKGTRPAGSSNCAVFIDQFRVWDRQPSRIAPLCTASCHPDRLVAHGYEVVDHVADTSKTVEPYSGATCDACHSMDLFVEHERAGSSTKGGSCTTCHSNPRRTFGAWNQTCQQGGCHQNGTTEQRHSGLPNRHRVSVTGTCTKNCHESLVAAEHTKTALGRQAIACVTCHNSAEYQSRVRAVAWDGTCATCHASAHAPSSSGLQTCYDCHGASSATIDAQFGAGTWNRTGGDHTPGYATSAHGAGITDGANGEQASSVSCEACHTHNAIARGNATDFRASGTGRTRQELCYECHSASGEETRTAKPNTWNGRDLAVEFARTSSHPVVARTASGAVTREETISAFTQTTIPELMTDTRTQTSIVSTSGATLLWDDYSIPGEKRNLLFFIPDSTGATERSVSQYDPEVGRWNMWGYNPANQYFNAAYYSSSAVAVGGTIAWSPGQGYASRFRYTPINGSEPDAWTAISDLPFTSDTHVGVSADESAGVAFYTGNNTGGVVYPWRSSDDTWLSPFIIKSAPNGSPIDFTCSDIAYSPEMDRLYIAQKTWYQQARLYWVNSPSSATSPAVYSSVVATITNDLWGGTNQQTALTRFTKGGHDYLVFATQRIDAYGYAGTYLISGLASGDIKVTPLPQLGWWSTQNGWKLAWDGKDYLYITTENSTPYPGRIRIPSDPVNGTWGSWELLTDAPRISSEQMGAAIASLDVTTAPVPVTGYRPSGTISADVMLPAGATAWGTLSWGATKPQYTAVSVAVQGWNGTAWVALPGLDSLTSGSVDLSGVSASTYTKLRLTATLSTAEYSASPTLRWWSLTARQPVDVNAGVASLSCASCHNSHAVATGGSTAWDMARVSDPRNTKNGWGSDTTTFCLDCHSVGSSTASVTSAQIRPYDVGFRVFGSDSFFPGWEKDTGLAAFTNAGHYTTSGTKALCETCHDPHGSNNAELTAWTRPSSWTTGAPGTRDNTSSAAFEQNLCFQCHGNGSTGKQAPGAQDIATPMSATYRHDQAPSGKHSDSETGADANANRHAECVDCHDPHSARPGARAVGQAPIASPVLLGATGLKPSWNATNWSGESTFTATRLQGRVGDVEAYVCFKCHTAASGRPKAVSSNGTTYTSSDLALEFNPNNASFHNVLGLSTGMKNGFEVNGTGYGWSLPADNLFLKPGWTSNSTVTCSDCHTSGAGEAAGPHGSTVRYLIDPAYPSDWKLGALDFRNADGLLASDIICAKCHVFNRSQNLAHGTNAELWATPAHTYEYGTDIRCNSCHISVPHGWKRPRLLGYGSDPEPYRTRSYGRGQLDSFRLTSRSPNGWIARECNGCGIYLHSGNSYTVWP